MAATTAERDTKQRGSAPILTLFDPIDIAASVACYRGAMAAIDTSGNARPARTSATDRVLGVFIETEDNSSGSAGDLTARITRGIFKFGNSAAADEVTAVDIGDDCYAVDDQTVAKTDGTSTRVRAGRVVGVDSDGVWVEFY